MLFQSCLISGALLNKWLQGLLFGMGESSPKKAAAFSNSRKMKPGHSAISAGTIRELRTAERHSRKVRNLP